VYDGSVTCKASGPLRSWQGKGTVCHALKKTATHPWKGIPHFMSQKLEKSQILSDYYRFKEGSARQGNRLGDADLIFSPLRPSATEE
jgi:hypothetical protein